MQDLVVRLLSELGEDPSREGLRDTPKRVEEELMDVLPERDWAATHHRLIFHGRAICRARRPLCERCPLTRWCDWYAENVAPEA